MVADISSSSTTMDHQYSARPSSARIIENADNSDHAYYRTIPKPVTKKKMTGQKKTAPHSVSLEISKDENRIMEPEVREIDEKAKRCGQKIHGDDSYLMKKDYVELRDFNWAELVEEFRRNYPSLFTLVLTLMLDPSKRTQPESIELVLPKLGLVYSIIIQTRNHELSRVQRLISVLLMDNLCDQKVFDRLQPIGICLSYSRSLYIMETVIGDHFHEELINQVKDNKKYRIVGDNINWKVDVAYQRQDRRGHMEHAFGSAALVQNTDFSQLSHSQPQKDYRISTVNDYVPSEIDFNCIAEEYAMLAARVVVKLIPAFHFLEEALPQFIKESPYSESLGEKTKVIPLPVVFKNEQAYKEVVDILATYEKWVEDAEEAVGRSVNEETKVHVGGDQMTRDRFSGAKRLRGHEQVSDKAKFKHLSPITFELFHLQMNLMQMCYRYLYKEDSNQELGTMKNLCDRISRTSVKADSKVAYEADKDFFVSFTNAYICEAALEFFGMKDIYAKPTKHCFGNLRTKPEKLQYMKDVFQQLVEDYVLCHLRKQGATERDDENVEVEGEVTTLTLSNGKLLEIMKRAVPAASQKPGTDDHVKNYGHVVLELGLLFKNLSDCIHVPDRDRCLRILKLCMMHLKSHSNLSKYALEILRLLIHQQCTLSQEVANASFYGLFVNTKGRKDSNIPADLQMEHLVRMTKDHLKHMFSNKTEKNISSKTRAIPGMHEIAERYDKQTGVVVRAKAPSEVSAEHDEMCMLQDLRKVRPFHAQEGRSHDSFLSCLEVLLTLLICFIFISGLRTELQSMPWK